MVPAHGHDSVSLSFSQCHIEGCILDYTGQALGSKRLGCPAPLRTTSIHPVTCSTWCFQDSIAKHYYIQLQCNNPIMESSHTMTSNQSLWQSHNYTASTTLPLKRDRSSTMRGETRPSSDLGASSSQSLIHPHEKPPTLGPALPSPTSFPESLQHPAHIQSSHPHHPPGHPHHPIDPHRQRGRPQTAGRRPSNAPHPSIHPPNCPPRPSWLHKGTSRTSPNPASPSPPTARTTTQTMSSRPHRRRRPPPRSYCTSRPPSGDFSAARPSICFFRLSMG